MANRASPAVSTVFDDGSADSVATHKSWCPAVCLHTSSSEFLLDDGAAVGAAVGSADAAATTKTERMTPTPTAA